MPPQAARTVGPPKGADAPMNQSREAGVAAPLPRGAMSRPVARLQVVADYIA
jgi:hypothetical protein